MSDSRSSGPDAARSRLRATIATIDLEVARLQERFADGDGKSPLTDLLASLTRLVEQLALGPEPEVRECPRCRSIGMRSATLCGHCWIKLTPPAQADGVA